MTGGKKCQVATLSYFEGMEGLGTTVKFLAMVIVWNAAVVSSTIVWGTCIKQEGFDPVDGFIPAGLSLAVLRS